MKWLEPYMNLIDQSYQDLESDAGELDYLTQDLVPKLKEEVENFLKAVRARRKLDDLIGEKQRLYLDLREGVGITAGLKTAPNWQSPQIGGKVLAGINDYSRDQSVSGNEYQKKFAREFVGRWRGLPVPVFLTNSGMGALTTILAFLLRENKISGEIFLGENSYFQNQELIRKMLGRQVIEFDEENFDTFKTSYLKMKPRVIFIDTLANTSNLARPDLKKIVRFLTESAKEETYLVVDNTCACLNFEPLKSLKPNRGKLKLLVWESLNKFYQYGMDRTIGGIFWGLPQDAGKLYDARMHAGTIMGDTAQVMLPTPNRKQLEQRLLRIGRNASLVTVALQDKCVYKGVGGSLILKINQKQMKQILAQAKKQQIPLIAGTSFGLNTTRIYFTASHTDYSQPFVRLSVGTETLWEMDRLIKLLNLVK